MADTKPVAKEPVEKDPRKARYVELAKRTNSTLSPVERTERDALAAEFPETAVEYKGNLDK